jgi:Dolichyl-phosphate-mannose-protein mannosyltransferase
MSAPAHIPLRITMVGATLALATYWTLVDNQPPEWDSANYLDVVGHYVTALHSGGLHGLVSAIQHVFPSRAPLYDVALLPGALIFGDSVRTALFLNVLLWPVLLVGVAAIGDRLFDRRTGTLAMLLVATMPLIVGLSHLALIDFLLIVLVTTGIACLLWTDRFSRTLPSVICGLVLGLGWLTKVTFPAFVIGPILFVAASAVGEAVHEARSGAIGHAWSRARNLGITTITAGVLGLLWYIPELQPTLNYVQSTTTGVYTLGMGPQDPLTVHNVSAFTLVMVNTGVLLPYALVGVAAVLALLVHRMLFRPLGRSRSGTLRLIEGAALLGLWAIVPYASVATSRNQDVRLMAAAMPALGIGIAALVAHVRPIAIRVPLMAVVAIAGIFATIAHTWPIAPFGSSTQIAFTTRVGVASYPLASQPINYEQLPNPMDPMAAVMAYLAGLESSRTGSAPLTVGVLESHPFINPNTLQYLIDRGGYGLNIRYVRYANPPQLLSSLRACDVILYVPPDTVDESVLIEYFGFYLANREVLVNQGLPVDHMTPQLLALFDGQSRNFALGRFGDLEVLQRRN